jgi:uncharacterized protein (TIGR00288 family)
MATEQREGDGQVAVLIDLENVGLNSIQWLFDQISDVGRIIVKRAYADWSVHRGKRDQLLELGIEAKHLFHSTNSGKNSSDISLAIDAVDLLYGAPVDTFVIVSSDSDFVPLVSKLRAAGKTVIGAGRRATASRTLVISCDRFFYLEQAERRASGKKGPGPPKDESVLVRAVTAACDEQGRVVGSKLYQTIQRMDPSFDYRAAGYSTFTRYLDASPEVQVVRPKGQGDVSVELADASPPEDWAAEIDTAWTERAPSSGQAIPASTAASDAAKVLGATKLSASQYKTLQKLLDAADTLRQRWRRDGNRIILR